MSESGVTRKLTAILCADVAGYSRLSGADEVGTHRLLSAGLDLISERIKASGGRVVNFAGDAVLADFASVVAAVETAVGIQRALTEQDTDTPEDRRLKFRIGVNLGDVIVDRDDIYGDGVNVAARLEGLADSGGICVSGAVYEQVRGKLDVSFEDLGPQTVKNIAEPVAAYKVRIETPGSFDTPAPASDKPSIAVLPFDNLSGDPEQAFFADGITEDIITALSRFRWFLVIARNSTFSYKGVAKDVRQIARELGVRYVLEGSVRRSGSRVRVTAQLIDASTGNHIWANRYDREIADIFDLQDDITTNISAALEPELYAAEGARAKLKNPENMDAWDLFLRARDCSHLGTRESNSEAQSIARKALSIDPASVGSMKVMASCQYHEVISGWTTERRRILEEALGFAEQAVRADPNDAEARQILGLVLLGFSRHDEALSELRSAVELNPNYAQGYISLGTCYNYLGELDKALSLFEMGTRLSPRDANLTFWRCTQSLGYLLAGEYDLALRGAKFSATRKDYWAPSRWYWAASAALAGNMDEVEEARSEVLRLNPEFSIKNLRRAHPFRREEDFKMLADGLRKAGLPE